MTHESLVEKLAEIAHESWAGWFRWMSEKWEDEHSTDVSYLLRWMRQAKTSYADLSEAEKESDRIEARKYVAALEEWINGE